MNTKTIYSKTRYCLLGLGAVALMAVTAPGQAKASEVASATIKATQLGAGEYQYT